jgi:ABC-type Mn2+/Zn2+ transport system permease subunit
MKEAMFRVGQEFVRHVLPQIIKPMRALWNEIIGFMFLALAAVPVPGALRHWRQFNETGEGLSRLALAGVFIGLMASFGIYSFLRARKISRS